MELVRPDWEPHDRLAIMMRTRTSGLRILRWRRKAWESERRRLNMNYEAKCVNRRRVDLRTLIKMRTQTRGRRISWSMPLGRCPMDEQPYRNIKALGIKFLSGSP
jgi:hypothetical protein